MNTGKIFEEDIKKSIDDTAFLYRLRDSGGSWQGGNKSRFTPSNICDFILFKGSKLYLLELKSHKGKSIPYTAIKQLDKLLEVSNRKLENLKALLLLNFADLEETYLIEVESVASIKESKSRKSLSIEDVREYGYKVDQVKKKVRYRYKLLECLEEIKWI